MDHFWENEYIVTAGYYSVSILCIVVFLAVFELVTKYRNWEEIKKGKIVGFQGSWGSGLAQLVVKRPSGEIDYVNCDNASTVRALENAFGNVIAEGHMIDNNAIKGKEIYYSVGDFGILEGFTPIEEASPELERKYLRQRMAYARSKKKLRKVV